MEKSNMTGEKSMIYNRLVILLLIVPFCNILKGQDTLPMYPCCEQQNHLPQQIKDRSRTQEKIFVTHSMPSSFKGTKENRIDGTQNLTSVWQRLATLTSNSDDTLHILHIGDSHVRGHIFPRTVGNKLRSVFGAISFLDMGVNGATCLTFTHAARITDIAAFKPDLLIMSFGTNESHGRGYNSTVHYRQMNELVKLIRDSLPNIPIIMTTPPGSYESFRRKKQKRTYAVNPRTEVAAETIKQYAHENGMAAWDMYGILGGRANACSNWQSAKMMRPDHVHYMPEGYRLQGDLFSEALLKAYNEYVSH